MKTKTIILMVVLTTICGTMVLGQTNFYSNVTNLWYQGSKSNVLEIANARLAQNTNDIAGLILKCKSFCTSRYSRDIECLFKGFSC
jgi:hypothetical protein